MKNKIAILSLVYCMLFALQTQAQATFSEDSKEYTKDGGMRSEFQKGNLGKIVFTPKRTDPTTITADQTKSTFNLGDIIYGRVFMTTCIPNFKLYNGKKVQCNAAGQYYIVAFIDGERMGGVLINEKLPHNILNATTFILIINGTGADAAANSLHFNKAINSLPDGTHTIKMELWGGMENDNYFGKTKEPIATGEFTLIKKPGSKAGIGRNFTDIVPAKKDPEFEKKILKSLKDSKDPKWKGNFTAVKIMAPDWTIERNNLTGVILDRTLPIKLKANWDDGHCTMQDFIVKEEYEGSGFQKTFQV